MSDREIMAHNAKVLRQLNVGDTVEFPRGCFSHWAVYIGNDKVVHLTGGDNDGVNGNVNSGLIFTICGQKFNKALVKLDDFRNVALGSKAKVNLNKDRNMRPLRKEEIVERALSKIGEIEYNVVWSNCEHFASWCRYGKEKSEQVETALTVAAIGLFALTFVGIVIASALSGSKSKRRMKRK